MDGRAVSGVPGSEYLLDICLITGFRKSDEFTISDSTLQVMEMTPRAALAKNGRCFGRPDR
ncbi:MAG: hypothetical protein IPH75_13390 [bacterium]|nr:hypothetical protein [bacterium]